MRGVRCFAVVAGILVERHPATRAGNDVQGLHVACEVPFMALAGRQAAKAGDHESRAYPDFWRDTGMRAENCVAFHPPLAFHHLSLDCACCEEGDEDGDRRC